METTPVLDPRIAQDRQSWIHSRLLVEREFFTFVREGFTMIAAGFGSFAVVQGLATGHARDQLPKVFALAMTAVGSIVIVLAGKHNRKMIAWVDADAFGTDVAPRLPDERRTDYLARRRWPSASSPSSRCCGCHETRPVSHACLSRSFVYRAGLKGKRCPEPKDSPRRATPPARWPDLV